MNHAGASAHKRVRVRGLCELRQLTSVSDESVSEASAQRNHRIITALRTAGNLEGAFALAQAPGPRPSRNLTLAARP